MCFFEDVLLKPMSKYTFQILPVLPEVPIEIDAYYLFFVFR